ncbi:MAG: DUF4080 domain-containing protein [Clostridiales bacterium]|jgi:radical SAM superfamily enzyme YgiQ (UPF0313 family)|nr:DUF4080 domain-containing protein [Clostridiales bacterium]
MKTVLLSIDSRYIHAPLAPFCLKEYANCGRAVSERFDIRIALTNINMPTSEIVREAADGQPDLIGISAYVYNREKALETLRILRERTDAFLFAGGPEASADPDAFLEAGASYVIRGEGEESFKRLLSGFPQVVPKGAEDGKPLEYSYSPYSLEYFAAAKGKLAYFESSRGCPYRCSYCMSADRLEVFDIEAVKAELRKFKGADIRVLKFTDRTFNADLSRAKLLARFLTEEFSEGNFPFHFEIAPDLWDGEWIDILRRAGKLFRLETGFQSFTQKTLDAVGRKQNSERGKEFLRRLKAPNAVFSEEKRGTEASPCTVHADLIAGLPYEDMRGIEASFDTLYVLRPDEIQLGILKLLKDSRIRKDADTGVFDITQNGTVRTYRYEELAPYSVTETPWLDTKEIALVKRVAITVDKIYNSGRFGNTLEYVLNGNTTFDNTPKHALNGNAPYKFFEDFTRYLLEKSIDPHAVYLDALFGAMLDFLSSRFDRGEIKRLLIQDYLERVNFRLPRELRGSGKSGIKMVESWE